MRMGPKDTGSEGVYWIHLVQDTDKWQVLLTR